jgi:excisionase family DNA binding protein
MGTDMAADTRGVGGETMTQDRLMDVDEVAEFLGLAVGTIYHFVSQNRLVCVRLSPRCLRFRRSDIESWIATKVEDPNNVVSRARTRK